MEIVANKIEQKKLEDFLSSVPKKYRDGNLLIAYYASFSGVFTPDMLYQLLATFNTYQKEDNIYRIHYIAISDLLLSDFCSEISHELFEMDEGMQKYLQNKPSEFLEKFIFPVKHKESLAAFIYQYAQKFYNHPYRKNIKDVLYWKTLTILSPEFTIQNITKALQKFTDNEDASLAEIQLLIHVIDLEESLKSENDLSIEYSKYPSISDKKDSSSIYSKLIRSRALKKKFLDKTSNIRTKNIQPTNHKLSAIDIVNELGALSKNERIKDSLLIFSNSEKQTWFIFTNSRLFSVLIRNEEKESNAIKWVEPIADLIINKIDVYEKSTRDQGVIILGKGEHFYSLNLFPNPENLAKKIIGLCELAIGKKRAQLLRAWEDIKDSFENGTVIKGIITSVTKGGLIANCNGLEALLPGSQIDIKPIIDYDMYVGRTMEFKVVKINETIKNAVVSHKALIESDLAEQREAIIGSLEKGQVLEGLVKNITDFGAFLDLGGVDGLLYITDISWGRINHPSEILSLNQKINVVVLDFDENKKRISLGLKQLQPHPWEILGEEVKEGSTVKGRIVNIEDYGAFLEIIQGVEGLIHVSEVTWSNQPINAREYFKINQEYDAKIVTIDREDRKMSLSIKQLADDPWNSITDKFPVESRHTGLVKNLTPYGVFIELEEGIGGMIHISDLSWTKRYSHPSEFTKKGQNIDVVVLDVDQNNRKLSLGHKQIKENPWDTFESVFPVGSYHEATLLKRDNRGAIVQLPYGLEAFAPVKHIIKEDGSLANVDDVLTVKVIEFNRDDKRILVSHLRYLEDIQREVDDQLRQEKIKERKETEKNVQNIQTNIKKSNLGDLDVFAELRKQLDSEPNERKDLEKYTPVRSILISQPMPTRSPYFELEQKYGLQIDFRPFIHVEPVGVKEFRKVRIRPDEFSAVIFTSKNAVDHFFRICEELRIRMSAETKYFCLSEAIANYLQRFIVYRKRRVYTGKRTILDLKPYLLKNKEKEKFILPCSNLGSKQVSSFLNENEFNWKEAIMYRTVSSDLSDLSDIKYDVLVFFSPLGITSLYENFPDFKQDETRIAIFGNSTSKEAIEKGLTVNIYAPSPEAPSMTMALEKYIKASNRVIK